MDEPLTGSLQYGDVGQPHYISHEGSWHFSRGLPPVSQLSYTGLTNTVVPGSSNTLSNLKGKTKHKINPLLKQHPELSATESIGKYERLSRVIASSGETLDIRSTTLLEFGNALDIENDRASRWIPIAVSVSGQAGDILSFYRIEDETVPLGSLENIRIPRIGSTETAFWNGGFGPIRQIQFAHHVSEPSEWMAARFLSATIIFRPLYRRYKTANYQRDEEGYVVSTNMPSSRLDPKPVAQVLVSGKSKSTHAHVAFNPWYQKQLGIIDEGGNWTVWNITRRQKTGMTGILDCLQSGALPFSENEGTSTMQYDGWATMEWVAAFNQIIACNRRCAVLYLIDSESCRSQLLDMGMKQTGEWILDAKRSSSNPSHIFLLTTLRVLLVNVKAHSVSTSSIRQVPIYSLHFTWYHFRDAEDLTLRLSLLSMRNVTSLLIYSRLNNFILELREPVASEENISLLSGGDFRLVPTSDSESEGLIFESNTHPSHVLTLAAREIDQQAPTGAKEGHIPRSKLIKLFRLNSNFEIQESLYMTDLTTGDEWEDEKQALHPSLLRLRKRNFRVVRDKKRTSEVVNNFIVKDSDVPCFTLSPILFRASDYSQTPRRQRAPWTVDFTAAYSLAIGRTAPTKGGKLIESPPRHAFNDFLEALAPEVYQSCSKYPYSPTMLEFLDAHPVLDNLDQASEAFRRFQDHLFSMREPPNERIAGLIPMNVRTESDENPVSKATPSRVTDLYDHIITEWLYVLPDRIPNRTRTFKERTIRQLVGEVGLATMNRYRYPIESDFVGRMPKNEENEFDRLRSDTDLETELPSRRSHAGVLPSNSTIENWRDQQEQKGPLPRDIDLSILPSLTQMKETIPFPKGIGSVLSHWAFGGDPGSYDWSQTTMEEEVKRSQGEKSRSRRTRSRSRRSQSRIPDDRSRHIQTSPIVPIIQKWGIHSQEGMELPVVQSSQITDENLPMTQVERGTFGGREAGKKATIKARKKKRAAGF